MSIFEFLERLDADPFDPELLALFCKSDSQNEKKEESVNELS